MPEIPSTVTFDRDRILTQLNAAMRVIMRDELRRTFPNMHYQRTQAKRIVDIQRMIDLFTDVRTPTQLNEALQAFQAQMQATSPAMTLLQ